jgi:hypothetical protein
VNCPQMRRIIGRGDGDITRDDFNCTLSRSRTLDLLEYALVADAELVDLAVVDLIGPKVVAAVPRTGSSQQGIQPPATLVGIDVAQQMERQHLDLSIAEWHSLHLPGCDEVVEFVTLLLVKEIDRAIRRRY